VGVENRPQADALGPGASKSAQQKFWPPHFHHDRPHINHLNRQLMDATDPNHQPQLPRTSATANTIVAAHHGNAAPLQALLLPPHRPASGWTVLFSSPNKRAAPAASLAAAAIHMPSLRAPSSTAASSAGNRSSHSSVLFHSITLQSEDLAFDANFDNVTMQMASWGAIRIKIHGPLGIVIDSTPLGPRVKRRHHESR
jgi:hypothetical protein